MGSFKVSTLGQMLLMKQSPGTSLPPFQEVQQSFKVGCSLSYLPSHAVYVMMAARVGSISDNTSGRATRYHASKASIFPLANVRPLSAPSKQRAGMPIAMHLGTVQTDFTRDYLDGRAMLQPKESAASL
ncbi:hypothetical protein BDW66DRAFT_114840 [Aspergillus desertorum]